jgi:hypothetical protein
MPIHAPADPPGWPARPSSRLTGHPASTTRIFKPQGCAAGTG